MEFRTCDFQRRCGSWPFIQSKGNIVPEETATPSESPDSCQALNQRWVMIEDVGSTCFQYIS